MIFVDSSYFIALMREKDRWHDDAMEILLKFDGSISLADAVSVEIVRIH
jgi:predicted nucleic acid-binding protein